MKEISDSDTRVSKSLAFWLRHGPDAAGLNLDREGWADTAAVLAALQASGLPIDHAFLVTVVARSQKQRFELVKDGTRIRARQGHSIAVDGGWEPAQPPSLLYHGTVERFVAAIMHEGLLPQARHHAHLSGDVETARSVGSRRGKPVILEVQAGALALAGGEFFLSSNGVWLVERVPPAHLRLLPLAAAISPT